MTGIAVVPVPEIMTAAARLVAAWPPRDTLVAQPEAFWNRLGLWQARIVNQHLPDKALVAAALERHGAATLQCLAAWGGLPGAPATLAALGDRLAEHLAWHAQEPWAQALILIVELLQNRRYEAVTACARQVLGEEALELVARLELSPRGARLAYALLLYGRAPANLELLTLYERAERFAYARHLLSVPAHGGEEFPPAHAVQAMAPSALTEASVDDVLAAFERQAGTRRASRCLRIVAEHEGAVVFIRRVLREASIQELEQTLFGDEAELIVLKFGAGCRVLEEHSTRGAGRQLGAAIAARWLGRPVCYVEDASVTPRAAVADFLAWLQQAGPEAPLRLVELHLRQAPVDGSPTLILRSQHGQPLAPALEAFAGHELCLLEELDDVRSIALACSLDAGTAPHLFRLRFDRAGDGLALHYTGVQAVRQLRQRFEAYLREAHGIIVVPAPL